MDVKHLKKIDNILKEMTENGFVAGANCLVLENGKEVYYGETGYIDLEKKIPVKDDSIFRLYSMTKPVTSAAVMLLAQDGLIDLNQAVGDFIPSFRNQTVIDKGNRYAVKRAMKIKDLLNMTAGLTYGGEGNAPEVMTARLAAEGISRLGTDNEMSTMEFVSRLGEIPLLFNPGEHFQYSYCADVLGALVETVSGMRFGDFLKKRIFEPLGMDDTGFYVPAEKRDRFTKVYEDYEGNLREFTYNHLIINLPMDHEPAFQSGGAGLCTTIRDYAKFATMLLNKGIYKGVRVMEEGSVRYMTTGDMEAVPKEDLKSWDSMDGFVYANLLRVMKEPGKAMTFSVEGEYGWDGWLGPYFINDPKHKITILHMIQKTNAGTTSYMRRIRNVVYAAAEEKE